MVQPRLGLHLRVRQKQVVAHKELADTQSGQYNRCLEDALMGSAGQVLPWRDAAPAVNTAGSSHIGLSLAVFP